jgi:hypothetical protein
MGQPDQAPSSPILNSAQRARRAIHAIAGEDVPPRGC